MKTIPKTILDLFRADQCPYAFVPLLDFWLPDDSHLRYAQWASDITYDGDIYSAWSFVATVLAAGKGSSVPTLQLTIEDAMRELRPHAIASYWFRDTWLTMSLICEAYPLLDYSWSTVTYDIKHAVPQGDAIQLTLGGPNLVQMRAPADRYWVDQCPYVRHFPSDPRCGYSGLETTCGGTLSDCVARGNETRFGGFMGLDCDAAKIVLPLKGS
jgi:hypothetical protein